MTDATDIVDVNDQISRPLLCHVGEEVYEFVPLDISDIMGPATDYLKMAPVAELLAQRDAFDPVIFEEMLLIKKRECKAIELGTELFSSELFKPKNIVYLCWLSLRKKRPAIKKSEFEKLLQANPDMLKMLFENIVRILALPSSNPKKKE